MRRKSIPGSLKIVICLLFLLSLLALPTAAYSESKTSKQESTFLEFFAGIYNMEEERYERIFEGTPSIWGGGVTQKIYRRDDHSLSLSLLFHYFYHRGKATITEDKTKLVMTPISFTATYMLTTRRIISFAGIGCDYYPFKEESTLHSTSGSTSGYHFQGGVYLPVPGLESLKVKLFLKYTKARAIENEVTVKLGGLEYGLGVVYGFHLF